MKRFFLAVLATVILSLGAFAQTGQPCNTKNGMYCSVITASFVPQKHTGYSTSIEVINGTITPITGTLTFRPTFTEGLTPDWGFDADGNTVCYDSTGAIVSCPMIADYVIYQWDIYIGTTHFVHTQPYSLSTNSYCGDGLSNSKMDSGNTMYYLCGDNSSPISMGMLVLIMPTSFLELGGPKGSGGYANLLAQDYITNVDGTVTYWQSGLYLPTNGTWGTLSNASTVAALQQQ